jgi:hypothetical protein
VGCAVGAKVGSIDGRADGRGVGKTGFFVGPNVGVASVG